MYVSQSVRASFSVCRYNILMSEQRKQASSSNINKLAKKPRRLHIGGKRSHPEWEIFDAIKRENVDHVGDAADLSRFKNGEFQTIYASHVLEHFPYLRQLVPTLQEWRRVLADNGQMLISVPDMDILCRMFLEKDKLTLDQRYHVMRMMFGGQSNQYDFHYAGLNLEILQKLAKQAGLKVQRRVKRFGIFPDHSSYRYAGELISLNVVLVKT